MERVAALGLDVGQKRIGVAGCDGTGLIATGLTTIVRKSYPQTIEDLRRIANDRGVEILVIGLPYSMDGSIGTQARHVQKFAETISKALSLPFEYMDERLTSYQAEQFLHAEKISLQYNKGLIDRKAAALILQQWLDERRGESPEIGFARIVDRAIYFASLQLISPSWRRRASWATRSHIWRLPTWLWNELNSSRLRGGFWSARI